MNLRYLKVWLLGLAIFWLPGLSLSGEVKQVNNETPFELLLETGNSRFGFQIFFSLKNRSNVAQSYLNSTYHQNLELILVSQSGASFSYDDKRRIMEYDVTVYENSIRTLDVSKQEVIGTGNIFKEGEFYQVEVGFRTYKKIKPGTYQVKARWKSEIDYYQKLRGGEKVPIRDIWLGALESESISVSFP